MYNWMHRLNTCCLTVHCTHAVAVLFSQVYWTTFLTTLYRTINIYAPRPLKWTMCLFLKRGSSVLLAFFFMGWDKMFLLGSSSRSGQSTNQKGRCSAPSNSSRGCWPWAGQRAAALWRRRRTSRATVGVRACSCASGWGETAWVTSLQRTVTAAEESRSWRASGWVGARQAVRTGPSVFVSRLRTLRCLIKSAGSVSLSSSHLVFVVWFVSCRRAATNEYCVQWLIIYSKLY